MLNKAYGYLLMCATVALATVSQDTLDDLTRFVKYASGAYQPICPRPLGNTLVEAFNSDLTDTQGYIARDDVDKQIVVVFRGSQEPLDFLTDVEIVLIPLQSQGVTNMDGAQVHTGFVTAFNSVASDILKVVEDQLSEYPNYSLVSAGHSLGGALASIAGVSLASNFPNVPLRVFTYGQPRTGNAAYAQMAEDLIGAANIFRAVHTTDGVPTIIPEFLGYRHHETEFWNFIDPSIPQNIKQCIGEEDPTCSDSIPSEGINVAHTEYFGQVISLDPLVCL